jgi:peptidoglycan/xylan/chitin deacetylase (PgdA/CDA1 family)
MATIAIKRGIKRMAAGLVPQSKNHSIILAYHSIGTGGAFSQPIDQFDEQMHILKERFRVVPLPSLLGALETGGDRLAAITFDDGFEDLYTCAFPVLRGLTLPFTVFLATGFLERGRAFFEWSPHYQGLRPLAWEQVREMMSTGCYVGSHTHSHPRLSDCTVDQMAGELRQSKRILESRTESEVKVLAYPFGQPHDYDRRVMAAAAKAGYSNAFTGLQKCLTSIANPYEIPRIVVDATDTRCDFDQKISGRRNFVARVERLNSSLIRMGIRRQPVIAPCPFSGTRA